MSAALGILVLLEKVVPCGQIIARIAGGFFVLIALNQDLQLRQNPIIVFVFSLYWGTV
jgi:predicted metal-binding membrane protein